MKKSGLDSKTIFVLNICKKFLRVDKPFLQLLFPYNYICIKKPIIQANGNAQNTFVSQSFYFEIFNEENELLLFDKLIMWK